MWRTCPLFRASACDFASTTKSSDFPEIRYGSKWDVHENRHSGSHTLRNGVSDFVIVFHIP